MNEPHDTPTGAIAIIGMSGRFPGARSVAEFWANLRAGVESVTFFNEAELLAAGNDPELIRRPEYVAARSLLADTALFDAEFFGFTPREAAHMDPQHRLFLECAWEALEAAGYDSERYAGPIGVYAGSYMPTYLLANVVTDRAFIGSLLSFKHPGAFQTFLGNDKDYLTSRVAYKMNLRGPGVTVQTACSTSLVAVCQAVQSLLAYQCDMALAGGVTVTFPEVKGYLHEEGGMLSPDGHCRAFDARAQGTVFGSGLGVVVLKRLADALQDGDHIHAVIAGAALNNDGAVKVSYAAPSIDGQAEVIALAHAVAGITADTIDYVEAHGTGTPLGDPIEVAALTQAFRQTTDAQGSCLLGSVKTNVGHLDVAAGIAGLIKTTLALEHREIPPTLHFTEGNPKIDFAASPFRVVTKLTPWQRRGHPRRAGVSSFGVGGTNAHVVLEEAPALFPAAPTGRVPLLLLSAKTPAALARASRDLSAHLAASTPDGFGEERMQTVGIDQPSLANVAFTLQVGRRVFPLRRIAVGESVAELCIALGRDETPAAQDRRDVPVVFMFPGQGAQTAHMGEGLYRTEPVFRAVVDECAELLAPALGCDLRAVLFSGEDEALLNQTRFTQPALFTISYALAQLWISWGLQPRAMIGHSVGEYVAACIAGIFSLSDALALVAVRARIVHEQPAGGMLAVRLSESQLASRLCEPLAIAAVNSPSLCVAAGPDDAIAVLEHDLSADGIACKRLATSHAFHSPMMQGAIDPFLAEAARIPLAAPRIPIVSCLTGSALTAGQATSPQYWASHLRETVRFADAFATLARENPDAIFLEAGPGQSLFQAARAQLPATATLIASLAKSDDEPRSISQALGKLWLAGATIDWSKYYAGEKRRRVPLPTYPFDRQRHWVEAPAASNVEAALPGEGGRASSIAPVPSPFAATPGVEDGAATAPERSRRERILARLSTLLFEMSGVRIDSAAAGATFIELGFDSLFLGQARAAFQNEFGVRVTFRQLLEEIPSPAALADHLDAQMPPEAFPAAAPIPPVPPPAPLALTLAPAGSDLAQIQAQLAALAEQVSAIRSAVAPSRALPPSPTSSGVGPGLFGPYRPVAKARDGGLTATQQGCLESFTASFTARTRRSKEYAQQVRQKLADPRSVAGFRRVWKELVYQIVVERSAGARVWDIDGNEYVDITMGFGVNFFGHAPAFVTEALTAQLAQGTHIGPQSPLAGEAATLFCELTGMDRATFCNTGSEAVMAAMRVARTVTGRSRIVYFTGDYHGTFDEVLLRTNPADPARPALPIAPGIPAGAGENVLVLEYGAPDSLRIIRERAAEIAAVIVEPVQSRHPELVPIEFLRELRQLTRETGSLLVFDEVITGFRVHPGGCQALFGIEADLAAYGKVVGGGIPIGVLAGRGTILDAIDGGAWQFGDDSAPEADMTFFAGTFVRHPLALAAACAVLRELKLRGPQLQATLNERTARFVTEVNALFEREAAPLRLLSFSSLFRFTTPGDQPLVALFFHHLLAQGIYIREAAQNCFLSTAHTEEDLAAIQRGIERALAEMRAGGFIGAVVKATCATAPLTAAQREIWLACELDPTATLAYNESFTARFEGALDATRLRGALARVVARHDALRASFLPDGSAQCFAPERELDKSTDLPGPNALPFTERDFSALPTAEGERVTAEICAAEAAIPFDLIAGPLFRAQLLRLGPEDHRLIFTAHHLICDGHSAGVILDNLRTFYTDPDAVLAPAPQFRDYAFRDAREAERAADVYWRALFAEPPAALDLPADFPRPARRTFRGARASLHIDASLLAGLKAASRAEGCTLFSALFAGFQALVQRLSGTDDFVIGIPVAGQSLVELDELVGHCANLLPLRIRLAAGETFAARMKATRSDVLSAREHGEFTFGRLLEELDLPRDPARAPLVAAIFNLDSNDGARDFGGTLVTTQHNPRCAYQFELGFNVVEEADGLCVECDYNADLFSAGTVARWLSHYTTLLTAAAADASRPLASLPLLSATGRCEMLELSRGIEPAAPAERTVTALFGAWARRTPDAPAVCDGEERITYAELDRASDSIAAILREAGVHAGSLIAVPAERSIRFVVALLASLKAGAAYVPFDPADPHERLERLRTHCTWTFDLSSGRVDPCTPGVPDIAPEAAYVLFTSGSTGTPKGVVIPHCAILRLVCGADWAPLDPASAVAFHSNPCFDASTFEIWGPLLHGARIVVTPMEATLAPSALQAHIGEHGVTTLFLTTALFNEIARHSPESLRGLRDLLFGGERADASAVQRVLESGSVAALWHVYGPTETTTFATCHHVAQVPRGLSVPIGRPIANTQVYVLDGALEPVPHGVAGEIYIGGPGLALGYLGEPGRTADRFIETSLGRLYRTGDRARWRADGTIEFLGRIDRQVKLRGFRIEPAEVEAAVRNLPGVAECLTLLRNGDAEPHLMSYFIPTTATPPAPKTMRDALARSLPAYMLPDELVPLERFPLTPNGKIDVAALPKRSTSAPAVSPVEEPQHALHAQLIELWEELLGRHPVGIRDDFFALGGHSLIAARMMAEIDMRFGQRVPLAVLWEEATIAHLAEKLLDARRHSAAKSPVVTLQSGGKKRPFFFLHGDFSGGGFYCRDLARHIDPERPFHALHPHGLHGDTPPRTIAAMAASRLEAVRRIQPHGPYLLGGFCNGALVAFEMARMLQAAGETAAAVVMLAADGSNFDHRHVHRLAEATGWIRGETEPERAARFLRWRQKHIDAGDGLARWMKRVRSFAGRSLTEQWESAMRTTRRGIDGLAQVAEPTPEREGSTVPQSVLDAYVDAVNAYVPGSLAAKVAILWPEDDPAPCGDPAYGWSGIHPTPRVILVPGGHHSFIAREAHLRVLGAHVRDLLNEADPATSCGPNSASACASR